MVVGQLCKLSSSLVFIINLIILTLNIWINVLLQLKYAAAGKTIVYRLQSTTADHQEKMQYWAPVQAADGAAIVTHILILQHQNLRIKTNATG